MCLFLDNPLTSLHVSLSLQLVFYPLMALFLKSPQQGAQTSIYCVVADELESVSGMHFRDCRQANLTLPASLDEAAAQRLWDISTEMTGLGPAVTSTDNTTCTR